MDAVSSGSNSLDVGAAAAIYSQKKSEEVQANEVQSVMKNLDENTQKQIQIENAQVTGMGGNLNIQG